MEELSLTSLLLRGAAVLILVGANAFFVAAEFALVASRRTRISAMVKRGDRKAKVVDRALQSLDRYISGTQLGITVASLGLGWIGEPAVALVIEKGFEFLPEPLSAISTHAVATVIAFMLITFLHIVLGELAPKALALLHPEATSRWVAAPLIGFTEITNPFIYVLNGTANALLRLVGARAQSEAERVHQPEEIVMLVKQTQESGRLATQDVQMIEGIFEFTEKLARDVMTPRTQIVALTADTLLRDAVSIMAQAGRSRFPVYRDSLDDVIGVVHIKDVLAKLESGKYQSVESVMRDPIFLPGTREVEHVLADMKRLKSHMAIVLDEYGGTAGLVTMEDLLEEIVGEIYDEYDVADALPTSEADGELLPGDMELDDAKRRYKLGLDESDYLTIGGYVFGRLGRLPRAGDRVKVGDRILEVAEMEGRRVQQVKMLSPKPGTEKKKPQD